MNSTAEREIPLRIEVTAPATPPRAGEWFTLPLTLSWPSEASTPVRLLNIATNSKDVEIDLDHFERDVLMQPGEVYEFDLLLRLPRSRDLDLAEFSVEVAAPDGMAPFRSQLVSVLPSLAKEIAVSIETVCRYEVGTKIRLDWRHSGGTAFRDVGMSIGSEGGLAAGVSTLRRAVVEPGDRGEASLVVRGTVLDVVLTATSDAGRVEDRLQLPVQPPVHQDRPRFYFLAPRRLVSDDVTVREFKGDAPVRKVGGFFLVHSGGSFSIVIRPRVAGVKSMHMREIAGRIIVRTPDGERSEGGWKFTIEINANPHEWFSRPERLDYTVDAADGALAGEVHLHVLPPPYRHLNLAIAFGLALTAQGIFATGRLILLLRELSLEQAFNDFTIARDYPVFLLLTIPTIWLCLRLVDWVAWRVRD